MPPTGDDQMAAGPADPGQPVASSGSARPAVSSDRGRSGGDTTYSAATRRDEHDHRGEGRATVAPPTSVNASCTPSMFFSMSSMSPRIDPYIVAQQQQPGSEADQHPAVQPQREAAAGGPARPRRPRRPGRVGRQLAPMSRRPASSKPGTARRDGDGRVSSSGHQRSST